MTERTRSFWRRRSVRWTAGGLLVVLIAAVAAVDIGLRRAEPFLRALVVEKLEERFHARVELDSFHVSLMNGLWAEGRGLRIWPPADQFKAENPSSAPPGAAAPAANGEPLIRLDEFRFHAPLAYKPGKPIRISVLELKGLRVDMPPRSHFEHAQQSSSSGAGTGVKQTNAKAASVVTFDIGALECSDAELLMETSKPGKLPMDFEIAHLELTNVSTEGAMRFAAELTNPRPRGTIHATGTLGPWQTADPGETPLQGTYLFDHADLATFKDIAGTLSSTGRFQGTLRDLTVDGVTETPDFKLTDFGNAMALATHFHAHVDGTDGDTWLDPVDATLGHSHFTARGQIVRVMAPDGDGPPHSMGHDIDLKVNVDKGRIEDFMRLASHSDKVLLTGDVSVKAMLHIPPGPARVHERLKLDGQFLLDHALFASDKIQGRITELSLRGQGKPNELKEADPPAVLSEMQGSFQMAAGVITLPALEYRVPGAKIELKGTYKLEGGALDFTGHAKLQATVSKAVGGWKGLLLTPADRYFKKDGAGTEVPIRVSGTREAPEFGLDFGRSKSEDKEEEKR